MTEVLNYFWGELSL